MLILGGCECYMPCVKDGWIGGILDPPTQIYLIDIIDNWEQSIRNRWILGDGFFLLLLSFYFYIQEIVRITYPLNYSIEIEIEGLDIDYPIELIDNQRFKKS